MERNGLSSFGRLSSKEHPCIIISKSINWLRRRSRLKVFPLKLFQNLSTDLAEEVVKSIFLFIALAAILFNVAEFFEQFW